MFKSSTKKRSSKKKKKENFYKAVKLVNIMDPESSLMILYIQLEKIKLIPKRLFQKSILTGRLLMSKVEI